MATPLDLAELRSLAPLAAGHYLAGCSRAELFALAELLGVRTKARSDKQELMHAVLSVTHPQRAA